MKSWDGKDSFPQMRAIKDTNAPGFYKGDLPDSTFNKLNSEILNVDLDIVNTDKKSGGESPTYSISIYYNSKKKQIVSERFPEKLNKLLELLFSICYSKNFKKNKGRLYIEE